MFENWGVEQNDRQADIQTEWRLGEQTDEQTKNQTDVRESGQTSGQTNNQETKNGQKPKKIEKNYQNGQWSNVSHNEKFLMYGR